MRTWVVQSNLGNEKELTAIIKACLAVGVPCVPIKAIPFDESPVDGLDLLEDPIAYGTVGFVQRAHKQLGEKVSLYDPDAFNTNSYRKHWGTNVLNDRPLYVGPLLWVNVADVMSVRHHPDADVVLVARPPINCLTPSRSRARLSINLEVTAK